MIEIDEKYKFILICLKEDYKRYAVSIINRKLKDLENKYNPLDFVFVESGGDNLASSFSPELVDLSIYVIDVSAGDKIPRKGGPGITRSDLLLINKIDLADKVGADLNIMKSDTETIESTSKKKIICNILDSTKSYD